MTSPKEPTRLQDRIDWDELAELTAHDMAEAEAEIKRQREAARAAPCCVCGEPESEGYCGCEDDCCPACFQKSCDCSPERIQAGLAKQAAIDRAEGQAWDAAENTRERCFDEPHTAPDYR